MASSARAGSGTKSGISRPGRRNTPQDTARRPKAKTERRKENGAKIDRTGKGGRNPTVPVPHHPHAPQKRERRQGKEQARRKDGPRASAAEDLRTTGAQGKGGGGVPLRLLVDCVQRPAPCPPPPVTHAQVTRRPPAVRGRSRPPSTTRSSPTSPSPFAAYSTKPPAPASAGTHAGNQPAGEPASCAFPRVLAPVPRDKIRAASHDPRAPRTASTRPRSQAGGTPAAAFAPLRLRAVRSCATSSPFRPTVTVPACQDPRLHVRARGRRQPRLWGSVRMGAAPLVRGDSYSALVSISPISASRTPHISATLDQRARTGRDRPDRGRYPHRTEGFAPR